MSPDEAAKFIRSKLTVLREDIARAKSNLIKQSLGRAENHARNWIKEQGVE